jgi:glutamate carboxypeptidase
MKGGTYCALYALRQVLAADGVTPLPVTFLFVPDEEVGSPTSRGLIEAEARRHRYVLVPEPAQESGDLIMGRWAFQRFVLRARGRRAQAGARLQNGRSAVREIAEQIIAVEGMSDPANDVTLSAGVVEGGTFVNVVPAECRAEVLAVTPNERAFRAIRERMLALRPSGPDVRLAVEAGPVRPLFAPNAAGLALYEHALACARDRLRARPRDGRRRQRRELHRRARHPDARRPRGLRRRVPHRRRAPGPRLRPAGAPAVGAAAHAALNPRNRGPRQKTAGREARP